MIQRNNERKIPVYAQLEGKETNLSAQRGTHIHRSWLIHQANKRLYRNGAIHMLAVSLKALLDFHCFC